MKGHTYYLFLTVNVVEKWKHACTHS